MSYLQNIQRLSGTNMGGIIASISVARKDDVLHIPDPVGGVIYGDITFKPAKGWVTWKVTPTSGSSTGDTRQNNEGSSKANRLPFSIARFDAALLDMLNRCTEDEFIVLHKDANGKQKIFGLLTAPVRFTFSHQTGSDHANKNQFNCQFFYEGPENMFEYNGAVSMAPAGPAPAIVKFNGVAIASLAPGEVLNIESEFGFTAFYTSTQ